jgi:hypothetical protein
MTVPFSSLRVLSLLTLSCFLLPGCFFIVDGDDDDDDAAPLNESPELIESMSYWNCDLDSEMGEYWFEFQTVVEDLDGLGDIEYVDVTVLEPDTGFQIDSFALIDEGEGVYGGLVWESESSLYCGEPQDVLFEVWDFAGGYDSLTLYY